MELADFARLGAEIAEKSLALKSEREKAAHILKGIKALEDELRPLVLEHTKLVAEMIGTVTPPVSVPMAQPALPTMASPQPQPQLMPPGVNMGPNNPKAIIQEKKQRIRQYILSSEGPQQDTSKGVSATAVAEAIGVEAALVREVLFDMHRGR